MKDQSFVANANIFILEDSDTVYIGKSDENGKFSVKLALDKAKQWKVICTLYSRKSEITVYESKDSCKYDLDHIVFSFGLGLLKHCTLGYPTVYYELNSVKHSNNGDLEILAELITEYSSFKLEFSQTISKKESPEVAKKRMAEFKSLLEKNGVPISNVTFSDKVFYLDESESDQRSRIQGVILSLE